MERIATPQKQRLRDLRYGQNRADSGIEIEMTKNLSNLENKLIGALEAMERQSLTTGSGSGSGQ
jgi:hypothetical protein